MMTLPTALVSKLRDHNVQIQVPDADTVLLRRIPLPAGHFNKPHTNLLVKRPAPGKPFLALVDENLAYIGSDAAMKTALSDASGRQGWKPLTMNAPAERALEPVVQMALAVLGFSESETAQQPILLDRFAEPIIIDSALPPTIGREEQVSQIVACLRRSEPCLPVVVGAPGAGKSSILREVARHLAQGAKPIAVARLNLLEAFAAVSASERMNCVAELLDGVARTGRIVAIEHIALVACQVENGCLLLGEALDRGARIVGTALPELLEAFAHPQLLRRLQPIILPPLSNRAIAEILASLRGRYAIEIQPSALNACIRAASDLPGAHPGKAIALLDVAANLALVRGETVLAADDVFSAAHHWHWPQDKHAQEQ